MKKRFLTYFVLGTLVLVSAAGCSQLDETAAVTVEQEAPMASLTLDIDLPGANSGTKSIASDPRNNNNTWTEWDNFVDGSLLYNVTLFVIDNNDNLVGYRQIHSGSSDVNSLNGFYSGNAVNPTATSGTAVKVTFPQSDPLHGNIELLKAGNYKLIAVANHASVESGSNSYGGLGKAAEDGTGNYNGNGDFNSIVSSIISGFSTSAGIAGFNATNYGSFFKYKLDAGDDRVCKMNPQPLVMIRNITLNEGNNNISGELSRTFARVRLEVNNKSTDTFLDISSLAFNGSYASKNAYLLNDIESGNANIFGNFSLYEGNANAEDNTRGVLGVTSSDAIISATNANHRVLASATEPIFDAYILEGKIEATAGFTFSFTATYSAKMEDGDATHNAMIASFFSNNKYNGSSSGGGWGGGWGSYYGIIDPAFYLFIRSRTSNVSTCLKADAANMVTKVEDSGASNEQQSGTFKMDPDFIWEIDIYGGSESVEKVGYYNSYVEYAPGYLKSLSSNLYMQPYDGRESRVPILGTTPGNLIFKMDFGGEDEHGTIFCQYNGQYYYLNGTTCQWAGPVSDMDTYKMLTFETIIAEPVTPKVKEVTSHIQYKNSAGTTINKFEIVRNDFYHGIIPLVVEN